MNVRFLFFLDLILMMTKATAIPPHTHTHHPISATYVYCTGEIEIKGARERYSPGTSWKVNIILAPTSLGRLREEI
jgi:hypothetical protein